MPPGQSFAGFADSDPLKNSSESRQHPAGVHAKLHLAYLIGAGLVLVAIAVALSALHEPPPEPVTEAVAETLEPPAVRAHALPADAASGGECQENGMRVVIGCGGCAAAPPVAAE